MYYSLYLRMRERELSLGSFSRNALSVALRLRYVHVARSQRTAECLLCLFGLKKTELLKICQKIKRQRTYKTLFYYILCYCLSVTLKATCLMMMNEECTSDKRLVI